MFLKTFLLHCCKTLETYFSWIIFHGGGVVGASGGGCIGETARLHHQLFVRRGDIHPCALSGLPLGLWTLFSEQQLHASLHLIVRSLFPHGLHQNVTGFRGGSTAGQARGCTGFTGSTAVARSATQKTNLHLGKPNVTSSFCIATGRRPHAMPVYGTSTMRCPDHARGTWGLRALNMTPYRGSTMCPHNKSRPQRIHAGREGPFAQSRALVNSSPPTKSPRAISPVRGLSSFGCVCTSMG